MLNYFSKLLAKIANSSTGLLILGGLTYANSLLNPFIWDDEQFIYKNSFVLQFDVWRIISSSVTHGAGVISNYYRPLTALSFSLDHMIWGLQPLGFHLTNLTWHLAAGVFLFWLLQQLFQLWQYQPRWPVAWLTAVAFMIHPLQTEAVTYINSRGDSLFAVGVLWAGLWLTLSLRHTNLKIAVNDTVIQISTATMMGLSFAGLIWATLAKEIGLAGVAITWIIVLSARATNLKSLKSSIHLSTSLLLYLIGSIFWVLGYLWARGTWLNFGSSFDFYQGSGLYAQSLLVRLLTFSKVIWVYLRLLLLPWPLHMERQVSLVVSWLEPWPWVTLALGATLLWWGWRQWQQSGQVWVWFSVAWCGIFLAPVSGIIPINGLLYEHWLYLPAVGWWLMVFGTAEAIWPKRWKTGATVVGLVIAAVWTGLTWRQNYIWGDRVRFYRYTLRHAESARLHNNLGMAYADAGNLQAAKESYLRALEITEYPQTHYNLSNLLRTLGDETGAETHLQRVQELMSEQ